jgi:hypothetical protein
MIKNFISAEGKARDERGPLCLAGRKNDSLAALLVRKKMRLISRTRIAVMHRFLIAVSNRKTLCDLSRLLLFPLR